MDNLWQEFKWFFSLILVVPLGWIWMELNKVKDKLSNEYITRREFDKTIMELQSDVKETKIDVKEIRNLLIEYIRVK